MALPCCSLQRPSLLLCFAPSSAPSAMAAPKLLLQPPQETQCRPRVASPSRRPSPETCGNLQPRPSWSSSASPSHRVLASGDRHHSVHTAAPSCFASLLLEPASPPLATAVIPRRSSSALSSVRFGRQPTGFAVFAVPGAAGAMPLRRRVALPRFLPPACPAGRVCARVQHLPLAPPRPPRRGRARPRPSPRATEVSPPPCGIARPTSMASPASRSSASLAAR
nr:proline-rich receptor-like protein kinase PERK10 [Aegilops tauschii subsp. strangulata]